MKPTFQKTLAVLVAAYFDNTLRHGHCNACVIGSLCGAAGYPEMAPTMNSPTFLNLTPPSRAHWGLVFRTSPKGQVIVMNNYWGAAKEVIDATGYSVEELARIEHAFESAPKGKDEDEWIFNGLMAVVDELADIHRVDLTQKYEAKLMFVR